jgi:hypothetical protein
MKRGMEGRRDRKSGGAGGVSGDREREREPGGDLRVTGEYGPGTHREGRR